MLFHLTAHAYGATTPLADFATAGCLWRSLERAFPEPLAAALVPDHLHLFTAAPDAEDARRRLGGVLGALGRARELRGERGEPPRWEPIATPEIITGRLHVRRMVRYIVLNPCRAGLAPDPVGATWTTHRDVIGATAHPWVTAERLAAALDRPPRGFVREHHAYVSADPSTRVDGTALPRPAPPSELPSWSLARVCAAAAAATRALPGAIMARTPTRQLFIALATRQGWRATGLLARACGVTDRAIQKLRARVDPALLAAGALCLGDDRLIAHALAQIRRAPGLAWAAGSALW